MVKYNKNDKYIVEKLFFHSINLGQNKEEYYEERKKGLALAMTLAVTMTSVPTAFALDGNAQPTKQPDISWVREIQKRFPTSIQSWIRHQ